MENQESLTHISLDLSEGEIAALFLVGDQTENYQ